MRPGHDRCSSQAVGVKTAHRIFERRVQRRWRCLARRGGGVAAYFGPGHYSLNRSITVSGGNYTVLGNGFNTQVASMI